VFAVNVAAHPMAQNWHTPAATSGASSAKRKPGNDPNRPKRPTSAYFYFVQVEREEAAKRGEKITRVCTKLLHRCFPKYLLVSEEHFRFFVNWCGCN